MNAPHPASSALSAERPTLADLEARDAFAARHIGPDSAEQQHMLKALGFESRAALIDAVVPANIRRKDKLDLGEFFEPLPETAALAKSREEDEIFRFMEAEVVAQVMRRLESISPAMLRPKGS